MTEFYFNVRSREWLIWFIALVLNVGNLSFWKVCFTWEFKITITIQILVFALVISANEKLAWCSHCSYRFCSICKMVYHGVEPCRFKSGKRNYCKFIVSLDMFVVWYIYRFVLDEKQKLFETYSNASKEEKLVMEKTYGKKQLALLVESTLSEKYIEKQSKPCPHCKIPIEVHLSRYYISFLHHHLRNLVYTHSDRLYLIHT